MNTELMEQIHEHITTDPNQLCMARYNPGDNMLDEDKLSSNLCGTARCIAGWATVLTEGEESYASFYTGCVALNISDRIAHLLFYCEDNQAPEALRLLIDNADLDEDVLIDKLIDITGPDPGR